jgi:outer membrane protein assembly factor BamA
MNLYIFNRVEFYTIDQNEGILILIEVTEQIYLYPYPIFTIHDRDWKKISYGLSLNDHNFRGQNERLTLAAWFGYQPGYGLQYCDPWTGDSLHLSTSITTSKYTSEHRIIGFKEKHINAAIELGKWWSYYFQTRLGICYDRISIPDQYTIYLHSNNNTENLWGINLFIRYDTRDLYSYPANGWNNSIFIEKNGIFQKYNNYLKFSIDIRRYQQLGFLIIASRIYQKYTIGQLPIYRHNYIGFSERIRGHFYDPAIEGRHIHCFNFELRFPLIPIRYFSYKFPGIPSDYLKDLKLGLSGGLFWDNGIIWNKSKNAGIIWDNSKKRNDGYCINRFISGFGFGLHFHIPYIEVFRLEYAMNLDFKGEFIAEIGVSF